MKTKPIIIICCMLSVLRICFDSKLRSAATKAGLSNAGLTVIFFLMLFSFQFPADAKTRLADTSSAISVFDAEELEAIPITDRLLMLTPNIAQISSADNVEHGVDWAPAIRGLGNQIGTQYGSYLVDSATIRPDLTGGTWGVNPNIEDLERVEIYSALQQPLYGRNSSYGVIVNRTDSLPSSVNVLDNFAGDRTSSFDMAYRLREDYDFKADGFKLGGPIVKDKLWFFGNFSLTNTQTDSARSNEMFDYVNWTNLLDPIELQDIAKSIKINLKSNEICVNACLILLRLPDVCFEKIFSEKGLLDGSDSKE